MSDNEWEKKIIKREKFRVFADQMKMFGSKNRIILCRLDEKRLSYNRNWCVLF